MRINSWMKLWQYHALAGSGCKYMPQTKSSTQIVQSENSICTTWSVDFSRCHTPVGDKNIITSGNVSLNPPHFRSMNDNYLPVFQKEVLKIYNLSTTVRFRDQFERFIPISRGRGIQSCASLAWKNQRSEWIPSRGTSQRQRTDDLIAIRFGAGNVFVRAGRDSATQHDFS